VSPRKECNRDNEKRSKSGSGAEGKSWEGGRGEASQFRKREWFLTGVTNRGNEAGWLRLQEGRGGGVFLRWKSREKRKGGTLKREGSAVWETKGGSRRFKIDICCSRGITKKRPLGVWESNRTKRSLGVFPNLSFIVKAEKGNLAEKVGAQPQATYHRKRNVRGRRVAVGSEL